MNRFGGGLIILLFLIGCSEYALAQDETVRQFLSFYFNTYHKDGIPDAGQIAILGKLITPEFRKFLLDAQGAEICHAHRLHNAEPPLLEGDLFTSLFEGAGAGEIAAVRVAGASAEIDVAWKYQEDPAGHVVAWQDRFYLVLQEGTWRITDVAHPGQWEFMYHGRVSNLLRDIAGQCLADSQ